MLLFVMISRQKKLTTKKVQTCSKFHNPCINSTLLFWTHILDPGLIFRITKILYDTSTSLYIQYMCVISYKLYECAWFLPQVLEHGALASVFLELSVRSMNPPHPLHLLCSRWQNPRGCFDKHCQSPVWKQRITK